MRAILWAAAIALVTPTIAVKPEDFKTCAQSSFCRRLRAIARRSNESPSFSSPYTLSEPAVVDTGSWEWAVKSSLYPEIKFELRVDVLQGDGIIRVRMDEVGSNTKWRRYNETARWALIDEPALSSSAKLSTSSGVSTISYGPPDAKLTLKVQHSPLKITQQRNGRDEVVLNDRSLLHMEHFRVKDADKPSMEGLSESEQIILQDNAAARRWFEEPDNDLWEERFRQWTDSKPKG